MRHHNRIDFSRVIAFVMSAVMFFTAFVYMGDVTVFASETDASDQQTKFALTDSYILFVAPEIVAADRGESVQFAPAVFAADGEMLENPDIQWSVRGFTDYHEVSVMTGTTISKDGLLSIAADEKALGLTVKAVYISPNFQEYVGTGTVLLPEEDLTEEGIVLTVQQNEDLAAFSSDRSQLLAAIVEFLRRPEVYSLEENNIARVAGGGTISASRINGGTSTVALRDGQLGTSAPATSWNTWGGTTTSVPGGFE